MSSPLLQLRNACVDLDELRVLDDISLSLASGEILGIAGSNGSGKSTLLRLVSGECKARSGSLRLDDCDLSRLHPRERARRLAVLPQQAGLQFAFSVEQLVALGRAPHRDCPGAGEQCLDQAIEACDLQALRSRSYLSLSGGERQRAQLARVLAQLLPPSDAHGASLQGKLLLLDEPTSALDVFHQEATVELLLNLRDRGCAILLVMHDINLLSRCADRLLFLREGRVLSVGATPEQLNEDALLAAFDYPMSVAPAAGEQPALVYPLSGRETTLRESGRPRAGETDHGGVEAPSPPDSGQP